MIVSMARDFDAVKEGPCKIRKHTVKLTIITFWTKQTTELTGRSISNAAYANVVQ